MTDLSKISASSAHRGHLGLEDRMHFSARFAIALDLCLHPKLDSDITHLVDHARLAARDNLTEHARLDVYLQSVSLETGAAESKRPRKHGPGTKGALTDFYQRVGNIKCDACTANAEAQKIPNVKTCERADERAAMDGGAYCLKPVFELFDFLVAVVDGVYRSVADPSLPNLTIKLETQRSSTNGLNGLTEFPPNDGPHGRHATITIDLPPATFDEVHLGELPYLMMHEIFVHSTESWAADGVRLPSNSQCALREGFMDAAAAALFNDILTKPAILPDPFKSIGGHISLETERLHTSRYDIRHALADPGLAGSTQIDSLKPRRKAKISFERLMAGYGQDSAIKLAAKLNMLPLDDNQKLNINLVLAKGGEALAGAIISSYWSSKLGDLRVALETLSDKEIIGFADTLIDNKDF